jgi:hypothetical protein
MKLPPSTTLRFAHRSATGETMFNAELAVYDEPLPEADTVSKSYV